MSRPAEQESKKAEGHNKQNICSRCFYSPNSAMNDTKKEATDDRAGCSVMLTICSVLSFMVIMVPAGHGAGIIIMDMVMVWSDPSGWNFRAVMLAVVPWLCIFMSGWSVFDVSQQRFMRLRIASAVGFLISWLAHVSASEMKSVTLTFSIPFLFFVVIEAAWLVKLRNQDSKPRQNPQNSD